MEVVVTKVGSLGWGQLGWDIGVLDKGKRSLIHATFEMFLKIQVKTSRGQLGLLF